MKVHPIHGPQVTDCSPHYCSLTISYKTRTSFITTRGWALDRVHNSRRLLRRLVERRHSGATWRRTAVSSRLLFTFWPCDSDLWPSDLIFIGVQGIVMDYLCTKFGNFSFSRFGFIMRTELQNHRQKDRIHRGGWSLYSRDYRCSIVSIL